MPEATGRFFESATWTGGRVLPRACAMAASDFQAAWMMLFSGAGNLWAKGPEAAMENAVDGVNRSSSPTSAKATIESISW